MRLRDVINWFKGNVFDVLPDQDLMKETDEWGYHSSVPLSGIIATGWLSNDDILVVSMDGIFIYDIIKRGLVLRDYEASFRKYMSDDNLNFFVQSRSERVPVFGIRGGGGNLLSRDNIWKLDRISLAWNVNVPRLSNYKTREVYFLELQQNDYEGYMYLGFSKSEKYFIVMGDGGLDVFFRRN